MFTKVLIKNRNAINYITLKHLSILVTNAFAVLSKYVQIFDQGSLG